MKNAVEATSEGGTIRIFFGSPQEDERDGVLAYVADNGMGIPEQIKSKLFTPFVTTKEESGSGVGLWVSRSIVEKYKGSIRISSGESGHSGTTVSIFLPLNANVRINSAESASTAQGET